MARVWIFMAGLMLIASGYFWAGAFLMLAAFSDFK